jgi:predicted ATPase
MVNLVGSGGVGKTRLALQVAGRVSDQYSDGVWFVDLAPLLEHDDIAPSVARALWVSDQPGRPLEDTLLEHLRGAKSLLVFDNCEHVLEKATPFVTKLLRSCPEVSVLATSREAVRVPGAPTYGVSGLPVPDEATATEAASGYESVRLFCERAALVRPDFALTHDSAPIVSRICRRLDGVPLAIELAAASSATLSLGEIERRLDDRFRVLTGGGPGEPRHETLRATVDWSHELLSKAECILFRRLAIFSGGFSLEAAEQICSDDELLTADVIDVLTRLVNKSLVVPEERGDRMRYAMLETIATYAAGKLAESSEGDEVAARHAAYFAALAERAAAALERADELEGLALFEAEESNLRGALDHVDERDAPLSLRLATATAHFWLARGPWIDAASALDRSISTASDNDAALVGRALIQSSRTALSQGRLADAQAAAERAVRLLNVSDDDLGAVRATAALANVLQRIGDQGAAEAFASALQGASRLGDDHATLTATLGIGHLASRSGRTREAVEHYADALRVARRLGNRRGIATVLLALGQSNLALSDGSTAKSQLEEALVIARQLDDKRLVARCLGLLAEYARDDNRLEDARSLHEETAEIARDIGDAVVRATSLWRLGEIAYEAGDLDRARPLLDESFELFERTGLRQGQGASLLARGLVALADQDLDVARRNFIASARIAVDVRYTPGIAPALDGLAAVAAAQGDGTRAASLLGAATAIRRTIDRALDAAEVRNFERTQARTQKLLGDRFDAAFASGLALSPEEALAYALTE